MIARFEEFQFETQDFDHPLSARAYLPSRFTGRTGFAVFCHGWGGNRFHRDHLAGFFEALDIVAVSPEYRDSGFESRTGKSSGAGWNIPYEFGKLQAVDALQALSTAIDRYRVDRRRLFLIGCSGGGHVALQAMAFAPHTFALAVALAPITRPTDRSDVETGPYRNDPKPDEYLSRGPDYRTGWGWQGVALAEKTFAPEEWNIRNCQRPEHVAAIQRKVVLLHGTADDVVDVHHSLDMTAALIRAGKPVSLHLLDGRTHDLSESALTRRFPLGGDLEQFAMHDLSTAVTDGQTDFDRRSEVALGRWTVSFTTGVPVLRLNPV